VRRRWRATFTVGPARFRRPRPPLVRSLRTLPRGGIRIPRTSSQGCSDPGRWHRAPSVPRDGDASMLLAEVAGTSARFERSAPRILRHPASPRESADPWPGVHPEGWFWRNPVPSARCSGEPDSPPPHRTSVRGLPFPLRREVREPRFLPKCDLREVAVPSTVPKQRGAVVMCLPRRCLVRSRCGNPFPGCRTFRAQAGRPASGPCSADESVTSPSLPRVDVLSFHGLCSPSRFLLIRRGITAGLRGGRAFAPSSRFPVCPPSLCWLTGPSRDCSRSARFRPSLSRWGVVSDRTTSRGTSSGRRPTFVGFLTSKTAPRSALLGRILFHLSNLFRFHIF
jgi:hypothetical protein